MFYEFVVEVSGYVEADSEEMARQEIKAMFHRFSFVSITEIEPMDEEGNKEDE